MAYHDHLNRYSVFLSPSRRGAADNIRPLLLDAIAETKEIYLCSQQVKDKKIINAVAELRSTRSGRGRVLIEADYLKERRPLAVSQIWNQEGDREPNRQGMLALLRSGVDVRADEVSSALQHVNMAILHGEDGASRFFLTSANFTSESMRLHFNWGAMISAESFSTEIAKLYNQIWDGDFRGAEVKHEIELGDERLILAGGAQGEAVELAVKEIDKATESIEFAYFNISKNSRVAEALIHASQRGVQVKGIVDGDQQGARWDGVPGLADAGIEVRYYPGALTGAIGRMHYKFFSVDGRISHLSTANSSAAAEKSFEFALSIQSDRAVNCALSLRKEIERLLPNGRIYSG